MARPSLDLWTHGVATIVEFEDRTSFIQHAGWGTLVRQPATPEDSFNWFHLAIPSVTRWKRDDDLWLQKLWLDVDLNENAKLDLVHLRSRERLVHSWDREEVNLDGQRTFDFGDRKVRVNGPMSLCVRIEFLNGAPEGQVIFRGAGGNFDDKLSWNNPS